MCFAKVIIKVYCVGLMLENFWTFLFLFLIFCYCLTSLQMTFYSKKIVIIVCKRSCFQFLVYGFRLERNLNFATLAVAQDWIAQLSRLLRHTMVTLNLLRIYAFFHSLHAHMIASYWGTCLNFYDYINCNYLEDNFKS